MRCVAGKVEDDLNRFSESVFSEDKLASGVSR